MGRTFQPNELSEYAVPAGAIEMVPTRSYVLALPDGRSVTFLRYVTAQ
jgi:hypothetical protein